MYKAREYIGKSHHQTGGMKWVNKNKMNLNIKNHD